VNAAVIRDRRLKGGCKKLPVWALSISTSKAPVLHTNLVTVEVDSAHPERVRVVGDDKGRWSA